MPMTRAAPALAAKRHRMPVPHRLPKPQKAGPEPTSKTVLPRKSASRDLKEYGMWLKRPVSGVQTAHGSRERHESR